MRVKAEAEAKRESGGWIVDLRAVTKARWARFSVVYGQPPGSHIGFWRTRMSGGFEGWNLRVGKRYIRTLTLMLHTRPVTEERRGLP